MSKKEKIEAQLVAMEAAIKAIRETLMIDEGGPETQSDPPKDPPPPNPPGGD